MNEYEVFIEDINSCGGEQYAKKELIEVEADSPESKQGLFRAVKSLSQ